MVAVIHPREPARRGGHRPESWWGRAFLRAVEETAYDDGQLARARALARSGRIGGLVVDTGSFAAAVDDSRPDHGTGHGTGRDGLWTVTGTLPPLDREAARAFVEVVAAEQGRDGSAVDALLAGELPHGLVEHAEEAGVELVPYGGELAAVCSCASWQDVCVHALAVLHQLGWLVDRDATVLLHLRGVARDQLLARLRVLPRFHGGPIPVDDLARGATEEVDDVEIALDAALRARRLLGD